MAAQRSKFFDAQYRHRLGFRWHAYPAGQHEPFPNIVYIGDGDTDVPALSLVRSRGGIGIAVFDPKKSKKDIDQKLQNMRLDKRADLITPAEFGPKDELFEYLAIRCRQIALRYRAEQSV